MPTHKKYTLAIRTSQRTNQKLQESIFSSTQKNFFPTLPFLINLFSLPHGLTANSTDIASNVNRFVDSVCGLWTVVLRGESSTAANRKSMLHNYGLKKQAHLQKKSASIEAF